MIKINLLRRRKRRRISLPDLSRLKKVNLREVLRNRALYFAPLAGLAVLGVEIFYAYNLKREIEALESEVNRLTVERDRLRRRANEILTKRKELQSQIKAVKQRIKDLEMSKDVIITLKSYYVPFNASLLYLYTKVPSTVWLENLSQTMDFGRINVELAFGSYDIDSIEGFLATVREEFPLIFFGEVRKRENKRGIIYYVSSAKIGKEIAKGGK